MIICRVRYAFIIYKFCYKLLDASQFMLQLHYELFNTLCRKCACINLRSCTVYIFQLNYCIYKLNEYTILRPVYIWHIIHTLVDLKDDVGKNGLFTLI